MQVRPLVSTPEHETADYDVENELAALAYLQGEIDMPAGGRSFSVVQVVLEILADLVVAMMPSVPLSQASMVGVLVDRT